MALSRLPKMKVSFSGSGEKVYKDINGRSTLFYKPANVYTIKPVIYLDEDIVSAIAYRKGNSFASQRKALDFLTSGGTYVALLSPKYTKINNYHSISRGWNVENRSLRLRIRYFYVYSIYWEDFVTGRSEYPVVLEFYHVFGIRSSLRRVLTKNSLMFFYALMRKMTEKTFGNHVSVGIAIDTIDVGWRSGYQDFSLGEKRRLKELGFFDSYTRTLREIRAEVENMI